MASVPVRWTCQKNLLHGLMIDAVTIKLAYVLTRSCVISGRRFAMMTRVHEIMRGQDGIIRISQNQNRTSSIVLQKKCVVKINHVWSEHIPIFCRSTYCLNVMLVSIVSLLNDCCSIFPRADFSPKTWKDWSNYCN